MKRYLLLLFVLVTDSAFAEKAVTIDDTAHFLAGLRVPGPLRSLTRETAWQSHASTLDDAWAKKDYHQLDLIRSWMATHADEYYRSNNTMYYMFGGPDFLYAQTFFPKASTYILAGLEPVGEVPDLLRIPPEMLDVELSALRASLTTLLKTHYFITKDMRTDLGRGHLGGTLPILYVFLARLGYAVLETTYVNSPAEGVKITFTYGRTVQTLYYFKTDLSGSGKSNFLRWCAGQGPGLSLLKAASYLMHTDDFAGVRNFLLENSAVIVQDDSGIPLHSFTKGWTVECFGRYVPHVEMFGKYRQADLAAIYDRDPPPPPLNFAFGYHWQKDRGILMLATRH
jgi:hypothetical protein